MILINLLPHREQRRTRRKRAFFVGLGLAALAGLTMIISWYFVLEQLTSAQAERNQFLSKEIGKLEIEIKDIATLKAEIAALTARQKAVEGLQTDRNVPVNLLNELVRQTPEGMYFTAVKQEGQILSITGIAQTQERVSEFLRNTAYNSEWLVRPELIESRVTSVGSASREQKRLFDFSVRVSVKRPLDKPALADSSSKASSAPAAAQPVKKL